MKQYILQFSQDFALNKNLDIIDLHILDYMIKWFGSGFAVAKKLDNKGKVQDDIYYMFSQKKLIEDMPILNLQLRAVQKRLKNFEGLNIIKRKYIDNKLFINICDILQFM